MTKQDDRAGAVVDGVLAWALRDKRARVERLEKAREKVSRAETRMRGHVLSEGAFVATSVLIDAKIALALLKRGGG